MFTLTEDKIISKILEFLTECDADELSRLAGELFGGKCYPSYNENQDRIYYEFTPDDNYSGGFDDLI